MATARARAVSRAFGARLRTALFVGASGSILIAMPAQAAPTCAAGTAGDDVCIITLATPANEDVDALGQVAGDTLRFGGVGNFSFDVARIGAATNGFRNFEIHEKVDANTVTLTGIAVAPANWNILNGTLLATGTTGSDQGNIFDGASVTVGAAATFQLIGAGGANETIGSLTGAVGSFVTLGGTGTLTTASGVDSTFAGVISGTGNFAKGGSGALTLAADNTYTGATTISGGNLVIGHAGAIDNSSAISIGAAAQLTGTTAYTINAPVTNGGRVAGNVTINGNVANSGGLLPGNTAIPPGGTIPNPGQSMGIITINGNYTGSSGAFVGMFVDLDAALPANGTAGTTHDFVNIVGNVSGGATTLFIAEFDDGVDVAAPTTGKGIQLFRVTGTTTPGAFVQGNVLNSGAYQYLLRYVANYAGTDDGYFLQSAIRDEMIAHPALLSASQALLRHCFRDDQRVPDSPKGATYGRAWFGYRQGNTTFGPDTGIDMDQDFNCTTGGLDWRMGNGWFGGVSGGFGDSTADLAAPAGVGNLDGNARVIEAYTTFTNSSLFVNLSAGYSEIDWTYKGVVLGQKTTAVTGLVASAQAGVALDLDPLAVKLIGAVNYDNMDCGESCFGFAVVEDTGLIEAKGTVRFDGVGWGGAIRPWAAVSYSDVLSDGINTVSLGAVSVSADTNSALLSIDAGLQAYLDENFALYADGGYHESLSKDITGYKAGIGLKLYW